MVFTSRIVPFILNCSNLLSDDLDKELERRGHQCARYADDLKMSIGKSDPKRYSSKGIPKRYSFLKLYKHKF